MMTSPSVSSDMTYSKLHVSSEMRIEGRIGTRKCCNYCSSDFFMCECRLIKKETRELNSTKHGGAKCSKRESTGESSKLYPIGKVNPMDYSTLSDSHDEEVWLIRIQDEGSKS